MSGVALARPVHPAADVWPMLPEPDLRMLAEDIEANGLRHPIVLDTEGRVLDGRNRLAACEMVDVEPEFETYDGDDPSGYIISANGHRRHMGLPERAAATALTLAQGGKRNGGRWEYGALKDTGPNCSDPNNSTWRARLHEAGLILDMLGTARLQRVANGLEALDAAVRHAREAKERQDRQANLRDDLRALVDAEELSLEDAERRAGLSERYEKMVAAGDLELGEAEHLEKREEREHRESVERAASAIESFLHGFSVAANLQKSPIRDDILADLGDHDRTRFLRIEEEIEWPTNTT